MKKAERAVKPYVRMYYDSDLKREVKAIFGARSIAEACELMKLSRHLFKKMGWTLSNSESDQLSVENNPREVLYCIGERYLSGFVEGTVLELPMDFGILKLRFSDKKCNCYGKTAFGCTNIIERDMWCIEVITHLLMPLRKPEICTGFNDHGILGPVEDNEHQELLKNVIRQSMEKQNVDQNTIADALTGTYYCKSCAEKILTFEYDRMDSLTIALGLLKKRIHRDNFRDKIVEVYSQSTGTFRRIEP